MKNRHIALRWLQKAACMALLACMLLPNIALADGGDENLRMVKNPNPKDRLHLRTQANTTSPSLGKYYNGVVVDVLSGPSNGFYKVRILHTDVEGYMLSKYLTAVDAGVTSAIPVAAVNVAQGSKLSLQAAANKTAQSLGAYAAGTPVDVWGYGEAWHHVSVNGVMGYMSAKYLKIGTATASEQMLYVKNPKATDRLHLRELPKAGAVSKGKYYNGVTVRVLAEAKDGWVKVQVGDTIGYMQSQYLSTQAITSAMPTLEVKNSKSTDRLHLRSSASEKSKSLGRYNNGTKVTVLGLTASWCHVTVDGVTGYMKSQYLSPKLKYNQ